VVVGERVGYSASSSCVAWKAKATFEGSTEAKLTLTREGSESEKETHWFEKG